MATRWVGGIAVLGLVAVACAARVEPEGTGTVAAQSPSTERLGSVGLKLQPVAGVTLTNVHYVVTVGAGTVIPTPTPTVVAEGNLPTPGTGEDFSFGIPLPVGEDYSISLSAQSAETGHITCAGSFGPFAVLPNTSTLVSMVLTCVDTSKGQSLVSVDVETDACPHLIVDHAVAEPAVADVGRSLLLMSAARDLDNADEVINYAWAVVNPANAGAVSFAPANGPSTLLTCQGAGDIEVRVTASNRECSKSLSVIVNCVHIDSCGNGIVEFKRGETCDWGAGPGHPADPTCPFDCTKICGDGLVEGDEECDSLGVPARECSPQCQRVATSACVACEQDGDCFGASDSCLGPGATPYSPVQVTSCYNVMQCVQDSGCMKGNNSLATCYCGTLQPQQCAAAPFDLTQPGAPNGPCAAVMRAGSPAAVTNAQMLSGLTSISTPGGAAGGRLNCQKNDAVCHSVCGFD